MKLGHTKKTFLSIFILIVLIAFVGILPVIAQAGKPVDVGAVNQFEFTAELLAAIVGGAISLLFNYFPLLNTWYAAKSKEFKSLGMLGMMLVVTGGVFGLGCANVLQVENFSCTQQTAYQFISIYLVAVIANQGVFTASPQTAAVTLAKANSLKSQTTQQKTDEKANASETK